MELKNIAVLCNYKLLTDRIGGMDRFFWLFDQACKAQGYQVTWFFPNSATFNGYENLEIIPAKNNSIEQTFLHTNQKFDVVFTHFIELCTPFFKEVKKRNLAKKIITVDHNPRPFNGYPLKKKIQKKIKGLIYSKYIDQIIGVSQYTVTHILKDFGSHLKNKCSVLYNGIDYKKFKVRESRNLVAPSFLVACHLRYSKGIQDLIQAVALLPKPILNDLVIDIYGDGDYKPNLQRLIAEHDLTKNFVFKGNAANLYDIYYLYDYMLQPTHMECFSLAILESLCANVPVITTPVGGNEEAITSGVNGYILPLQNPLQWSILLQELYLGDKKIDTTTNPFIENNFSIDTMVNQYVNLIK